MESGGHNAGRQVTFPPETRQQLPELRRESTRTFGAMAYMGCVCRVAAVSTSAPKEEKTEENSPSRYLI
jgi:hypothetical protein